MLALPKINIVVQKQYLNYEEINMDETENETQEELDAVEAIAESGVEEPDVPEPPAPPAPPELEEAELAADEALEEEVSSKPYWQRVYDGDIEGPAFKHVDAQGNFTGYTLEEVLSSDKPSAQKAAYLSECIAQYKEALVETDYIALKLAEGVATAEEYAGKLAERQVVRDTINAYQDAIDTLKATQE